MSTKQIEQELIELKERLAKVEATVATRPGQAWRETIGALDPKQGWQAGFGAMKGSTLLREAARLGAEYRAKENKRK